MWKNKKVSVILPTYNEKDSIKSVIESFFNTNYVDEVIVVNNNAIQGTYEEVKNTSAIHLVENRQGYGYALWHGFDRATGDLIIISEPDGTFEPKDIAKLLVYSENFDTVWGTRTNIALIGKDANMGMFLRIGNVFVAKIVQNLFNTSRLTDVGCTFKLFKKEVIHKIRPKFRVGSQHFGPELMLLTILNGYSIVEIPVNYYKRVGVSSVTGNKVKAFVLGLKMMYLVFKFYVRNIFKKREKIVSV